MKNLIPIILTVSLFLVSFSGFNQNYIGLHKDEIRKKVSQELSGFAFTKEIFNNDRSFIKFENRYEEQTLLFILNTEGYCTSVSRMYNTWLFNRLKDELTTKYGNDKNLKWEEECEGNRFEIELVRGKWFVTVVTKLKSK